ncbi:hypothetical protein PIB30_057336 [Stylosanthes scabra]|uniref:Uncharacterized protein n=1 Tax=Stylosanthes scabra TaxID=79078 RepID=A0ABU6TJG1_9FABA|nr:hypothetical protein [Stylosanthes scabra]
MAVEFVVGGYNAGGDSVLFLGLCAASDTRDVLQEALNGGKNGSGFATERMLKIMNQVGGGVVTS